jgi:hypothetical protein
MGAVAKAISSIFGGKAPKANVAPALSEVDAEAEKNKQARSALLAAAATGNSQLQPGQVGAAGGNVFGN